MSGVDFNLNVTVRNDLGKGASRRLRRTGQIPGVLYGAGSEAAALNIDHDELLHHLEHEAFFSHVLTLNFGDRSERAVLKDLQRHPSKPVLLHADFLRVSDSDVIRMHVPLHYINEDVCPGRKAGGVVTHNLNEVEVVCLPGNLPEYLAIDLANLNVGESAHLSDIALPDGVQLVALQHGPEHDLPVVTVQATRATKDGDEEASAS